MNAKHNNHLKILFIAAFIAALFSITPAGVQIDNAIYDAIIVNANTQKRSSDVVVIGIDEPSFQQLALQWPWPRSIHAKLIEQLTQQNAKVIAFDLLFPENTNPQDDDAFARAISQSNHVVIGTDFKIIKHPTYTIKTAVQPISTLIDAGARTGHVSISVENDGFVRNLQPVLENTPSLAFTATSLFKQDSCCQANALPLEILINYSGSINSFEQVSYYQALDADTYLPKEFFKGKLVFVGVKSLSASLPDRQSADHYATPLTRWGQGYTAGVMIHAYSAASMLEDSWATITPRFLIAIGGFIIALLFAKYGMREQLKYTFVLATIIAILTIAGTLYIYQVKHIYITLLSSLLPITAVSFTSPYYNFLLERRRKKEIRKAFGIYVNQAIVRQIEENPDNLKLGGKQIDGTVLFMDIAGFSTLTEQESPEVMIAFINDFLSAMIEIGMAEGGTVERFLGDAIMLIWGAPVEQKNHATMACTAAIKMEKKIREISQYSKQTYGFDVSARIGINSGSMTAGNIGGKERFCYTVLGDCVNLAARFEAANKVYNSTTIIGESTKELLDSSIYSRLLDVTKVKGRDASENLHELIGHTDEVSTQLHQSHKAYANGLNLLLKNQPTQALIEFNSATDLDDSEMKSPATLFMIERSHKLIANPMPNDVPVIFDISKI